MPRATFRRACVIAALVALSFSGCQNPPPEQVPEAAPPPRAAAPKPPAAAPAAPVAVAPAEAPPHKLVTKKKATAKKRAPKPDLAKLAPPPPPPPPPPPDPAIERARALDEYLAGMRKTVISFNPPSPMEVEHRAVVPLSAEPPKDAGQLAEQLRKTIPGAEAWKPRLRAQLAAADFEIAPLEGKEAADAKDLSPIGRTEWSWGAVPKVPGTKQLTVRVAILLPPGAGEPRELPALTRTVSVESTPSWIARKLWNDYWAWIVGALALAVAALVWWRR